MEFFGDIWTLISGFFDSVWAFVLVVVAILVFYFLRVALKAIAFAVLFNSTAISIVISFALFGGAILVITETWGLYKDALGYFSNISQDTCAAEAVIYTLNCSGLLVGFNTFFTLLHKILSGMLLYKLFKFYRNLMEDIEMKLFRLSMIAT